MTQDPDQRCAICQGRSGAICKTFSLGGRDALGFACEACGEYEVSRTAQITWLDNTRLSVRDRAALSHRVRTSDRENGTPLLTTDWLEHFVIDARLPNPALQATNLIRVIGDHQTETGEAYFIDSVTDTPLVGAFNATMFDELLAGVRERGWVKSSGQTVQRPNPRDIGVIVGTSFILTLAGWEHYEAEQKGKIAGRYGFIAMKFGDPVLEMLVKNAIRPGVKDALNYDVLDTRSVARAGIIDNLMREQIRDAAFVLVDLTHDNAGAYWEAGYAEGLGKPVIYLCERSKFDRAKPHFDTNHCTTVMWATGSEADFIAELNATLRRSLSIFG